MKELTTNTHNSTHKRWLQSEPESPSSHELRLTKSQRTMRHYKYNIYVLNSMALRIQHWFFLRCDRSLLPTGIHKEAKKPSIKLPGRKERQVERSESPVLLPRPVMFADSPRKTASSGFDSSLSEIRPEPKAPIKNSQKFTLGRKLQLNDGPSYQAAMANLHDDRM